MKNHYGNHKTSTLCIMTEEKKLSATTKSRISPTAHRRNLTFRNVINSLVLCFIRIAYLGHDTVPIYPNVDEEGSHIYNWVCMLT